MATLEPPKVVNLTEGAVLGKKDGEPYGYTDSELAGKVAGTGTFVTAVGLDADTAALVADSGSDTRAALDQQFAPLANPTFTGNVVVPDADAATEALNRQTADARYLALDGSASAGFIRKGTGSPQGVVTAPVGTFYMDTDITLGARLWFKQTGTGDTGWVVLDADTGWRDVSGSLLTGWTATRAWVRRINNQCFAWFHNLDYSSGGNSNVYDGPASLAPADVTPFPYYSLSGGSPPQTSVTLAVGRVDTNAVITMSSTLDDIYAFFTWITDADWFVSSLPGTAA